MKLVNKINLRFLILLLIIFTLAGLVLYFVLGVVVDENIDEILAGRAEKVKQTLKLYPNQRFNDISPDQSIKVDLVSTAKTYKIYQDTMVFDVLENEDIECRKLTFQTNVNGQFYKVQIILARFETEDLVELIFYFMISLFVVIGVLLFLFNKWLSKSMWNPFFKTLDQLKQFKIGTKSKVAFADSNIYEFDQLNNVLANMMHKIQNDFNNLKEFTENASHEIQTPLAIIKSKLEMVLQDKLLDKRSQQQIQTAYKTVSRLSKLNEALLLLSKIENRQFTDAIEINLCDLIKERVELIEELISLKNISIKLFIEPLFKIDINQYLAETLISNLLGNTIKHNIENGQITISSFDDRIIFSNTGHPLGIESEKIFQRFVKSTNSNESNGLGLSIVSEICRNYNLLLQYNYQNALHNFILSKNH